MGAKLRVDNETSKNLLVQVELSGMTKIVTPSSHVIIDSDFDKGEAIHLDVRDDRVVVWGGVAANIFDEGSSSPPAT